MTRVGGIDLFYCWVEGGELGTTDQGGVGGRHDVLLSWFGKQSVRELDSFERSFREVTCRLLLSQQRLSAATSILLMSLVVLNSFSQLLWLHRRSASPSFWPRGRLSAALEGKTLPEPSAIHPNLSIAIYSQYHNNNPHSFDITTRHSGMLQSSPHHDRQLALPKKRQHGVEFQARVRALSSTTAIVGPVVATPQSTVVPVVTSVTKKGGRTTEGLSRSNAATAKGESPSATGVIYREIGGGS